MAEFFRLGGWGMFPTLGFGFLLVVVAVLALVRPERRASTGEGGPDTDVRSPLFPGGPADAAPVTIDAGGAPFLRAPASGRTGKADRLNI